MKSLLQLLKEANDILRSVNSIIERRGEKTNWKNIDKKVKMALAEQHELLLAKYCYISDVLALDIPAVIRWVAIAEKMPDSGKCILIYSNLGGVAEGAWNESKQYFEQWRWSAIINDVTHWAELPEPPCV